MMQKMSCWKEPTVVGALALELLRGLFLSPARERSICGGKLPSSTPGEILFF